MNGKQLCRAMSLVIVLSACGQPPDGASRSVAFASTPAERQPVPSGEELAVRLGCGGCHPGVRPGEDAGPLPEEDRALDPAAIYAYLLDPPPAVEGVPRMPDFGLSETEAAALALNVAASEPGSSGADASELETVIDARPVVADSAMGRRVRTALRCDACHGGAPVAAAPPLPLAAGALKPEWLRSFLARPHAVRPFGWRPGSSTRMPDFRLTPVEIDSLVAWLQPAPPATVEPEVAAPSPRQRENTLALMRDRWSCFACHAWNGAGGRIGPDLALAADRLKPSHIRAMLEDPARAAPGAIMPRPLLEPHDVDRIVAVLAYNDETRDVWREPLSLMNPNIYEPAQGDEPAAVYDRACALCHGRSGEGNGINAEYLPARPANHADSVAMSHRPDDTLYDGIAAGGRILGGTGAMPAFGGSFDPELIGALVAHIRTLCNCEGPAWSRDGVSR